MVKRHALTPSEIAKLHDLESILSGGAATFHAFIRAAMTVHDELLYLHTHDTWQAYLDDHPEWDLSRYQIHRHFVHARIVDRLKEELLPTGNKPIPLPNERQSRELNRLPIDQRAKVWEQAAAEPKPTAARVAELAQQALDAMSPAARSESTGGTARCARTKKLNEIREKAAKLFDLTREFGETHQVRVVMPLRRLEAFQEQIETLLGE